MNIKEIVIKGKEILNQNNIEEADLISKMLLSSILGCRREELIVNSKKEVEKEIQEKFLKRNRKNCKWISCSIFNR